MEYLTRKQVRAYDRRAIEQLGAPGVVLMENAGRSCAEKAIAMLGGSGNALVLCGGGNNGGDGFVIARHLIIAGVNVRTIVLAEEDKYKGDALINLGILKRIGAELVFSSEPVVISQSLKTDIVIDAVLGTGFSGELRERTFAVIEQINSCGVKILSVDVPSGLDCDTGQPSPIAVKADNTVTFVAMKAGFACPTASEYLGEVTVCSIGV
jgi:NAD(P)H-hydrate epimerase